MMLGGDPSIFGRARTSGLAPASAGNAPAHPLLTDSPSHDSQLGTSSGRRHRRGAAANETPEYAAWVQSIESMVGAGAVEALQDLLGRNGLGHLSGPDQIRLQLAPGPDGGLALVIEPNLAGGAGPGGAAQAVAAAAAGGRHHRIAPHTHTHSARRSSDRYSTQSLIPIVTPARWGEEVRVATGILPAERTARLTNYVINVLHPAARTLAAQTKKVELERQAEADRAAEEEEKREAAEREDEERAAAAKRADEDAATAAMEVEATPAVVEAPAPAPALATGGDVPMDDGVAEVMNLARSLAAGFGAALPTPPVAPSASEGETEDEMDEDEDEDEDSGDDEPDADADDAPEASGSGDAAAEQQRVIVSIHGEDVDITDTGIDPTFLEALPDDMREEVLNQHFRESRATGRSEEHTSELQ